jgi:ribose transport system permease protein
MTNVANDISVDSPRTSPRQSPGSILLQVLERGGLVILGAALILLFATAESSGEFFRSSANWQNLLTNQSVTGIVALAMVVPLVCGYFDLSVGAVAGIANVSAAALIGTHGLPVVVGVIGAVAIAALAGLFNGFLVAVVGLNGFVVTLGTFTLGGGLIQLYTGGLSITAGIPTEFIFWGSQTWLGLPRPLWLLFAVAAIAWYGLTQTPFGKELEAIGSSERAAHLVGIRVRRNILLSFVGSATLAGIAGVLLTSRAGGADPSAGQSYLFPALAAVFLGATTIRPGVYNVVGTILGVFFVAIAVNGFSLLGADTWVTPVFNGAALVVSVAISTLIGRRRDASKST